jgi:UDP-N-acetyl-D-mannosaminuronic acid dehydrogenase
MNRLVNASEKRDSMAFCPERVAEGHALREMVEQPQIVAGCDQTAQNKQRPDRELRTWAFGPENSVFLAVFRVVENKSEPLFRRGTQEIVPLSPLEAELTKIFTSTWRYMQFATANQFYMIAADHGIGFYRIHQAMTYQYPRMAGGPCPGFTAGPRLFKEAMQLLAAANHQFAVGHAAMLINEGLHDFVVRQVKAGYRPDTMRVGIPGKAFKAESDDPPESLSFKLKKLLAHETAEVLCTDEYIRDPSLLSLSDAIERADLLIIGAPHQAYRELDVPPGKPVPDLWNILGKGGILS